MEHCSSWGTGYGAKTGTADLKNNVSKGSILKSRVVIFLHRTACHQPDSGGFSALS